MHLITMCTCRSFPCLYIEFLSIYLMVGKNLIDDVPALSVSITGSDI